MRGLDDKDVELSEIYDVYQQSLLEHGIRHESADFLMNVQMYPQDLPLSHKTARMEAPFLHGP